MIEDIQKNQSRTFSGSFRENLKLSNTLMNSKKSKSYFFASKIVLFIELFPPLHFKASSQDLIGDETVPPYSGTLRCVGHSFGMSSQPFIPILEFTPSNKIFFAACSLEDSLYQTVEI
jgi:hypothetical protein